MTDEELIKWGHRLSVYFYTRHFEQTSQNCGYPIPLEVCERYLVPGPDHDIAMQCADVASRTINALRARVGPATRRR